MNYFFKLNYFLIVIGFLALLGCLFLFGGQTSAKISNGGHWFNLPQKIEIDTVNNLLYVLNENNFITVLDANDYSLVQKIEVGQPYDLYADNVLGRVFLVDFMPSANSSRLLILDMVGKDILLRLSSQEILQKATQINLTIGRRPIEIFLNPEKQLAYLLNSNTNSESISVIDLIKNQEVSNIELNLEIYQSFKAEYDSVADKIYLMPRRGGGLLIVDPQSEKISVADGEDSNWLDFALNVKKGEIYAINRAGSLAKINVNNGKILASLSLEKIAERIFFDSGLDKILVTSRTDQSLSLVDSALLKIERVMSLPNGAVPASLAVNSNQNKIYLANLVINKISIIDTQSFTVKYNLGTPATPDGPLTINPVNQDLIMPIGQTFINALFGIRPDNKAFLVPKEGDPIYTNYLDSVRRILIDKITSNLYVLNANGKFSKLTAIDPKEHQVLWATPVRFDTREIIVDYQKDYLYVMSAYENVVSIINRKNGSLIGEIKVGSRPMAIAANSDFSKVYTANRLDNTISVIDTVSKTVTQDIKVGQEPLELFYSESENLLYVLNSGSNSVSVIGGDQVVGLVDLGKDVNGANALLVGSPELGKVYVINTVGNIYIIYKDGEGFGYKMIRAEYNKQIGDAILNSAGDKIYLAEQNKQIIDIFDLQQEQIKSSIDVSYWGSPVYLLSDENYIFMMTRNGYIGLINSQSDIAEGIISLNSQGKKGLPSNYVNWVFNFSTTIRGPGRGAYSENDQKIYFPTIAPNRGGIAVFDVNRRILSDLLTYDNLAEKKIKFSYLLIGGAGILILLVLIGLLISRSNKLKNAKDVQPV